MPIHHDRFGNDIPYSAHTHVQTSLAYDCPPTLSPSPLASRDDPFSHTAGDDDYSGHAYTASDLAKGSLYADIYNMGYVDSAVPSDGAWPLSDIDLIGGDVAQYSQTSDPICDSVYMKDSTLSDVGSNPRKFCGLDGAGTQAVPLNLGVNVGGSYCNAFSPGWPLPRNLSCSIPESSYSGSTYDDWSSISPSLDAQMMPPPRCDSAGPCSSAIQIMDSHESVLLSFWDGSSPGSYAESSYSPMYGTPNLAWNVTHELQSPNMGTSSQPASVAAATIKSESRDVCARCSKQFAHSADLTRHMKTQHGMAGTGYRCAHPGCPKIHKIWLRLDSFKKHVRKQHHVENNAEVKSLVERSVTGEHGLPIAMTSLSISQVGSPASRVHHSVTL
ncbi:hypothetical protein B5807_12102 [Epicoccum nigrum]|uniref:C2H2-type domain-containing protein n=1 Tax=Epicoccum nigrum TaxID=105696 RepID=A0A1Y2LHB5_EPING|nr:hypothetical protein B5807_12102 [Epicoccum nigrum]